MNKLIVSLSDRLWVEEYKKFDLYYVHVNGVSILTDGNKLVGVLTPDGYKVIEDYERSHIRNKLKQFSKLYTSTTFCGKENVFEIVKSYEESEEATDLSGKLKVSLVDNITVDKVQGFSLYVVYFNNIHALTDGKELLGVYHLSEWKLVDSYGLNYINEQLGEFTEYTESAIFLPREEVLNLVRQLEKEEYPHEN